MEGRMEAKTPGKRKMLLLVMCLASLVTLTVGSIRCIAKHLSKHKDKYANRACFSCRD